MSSYTITALNTGPQMGGVFATSADGSVIVTANYESYVWVSRDFGATWTSYFNDFTRQWISVSVSADGTNIVVSEYRSDIYLSTNSGENWTSLGSPEGHYCIALQYTRDTLSKLFAVTLFNVYMSTDNGTNWTSIGGGGAGTTGYNKLSVSDNGQKVIFISNDSYVTIGTYNVGDDTWSWVQQLSLPGFSGIYKLSLSMSGNGEKIIVCRTDGTITYSIDGGTSFSSVEIPTAHIQCAILSQDGTQVIAVASDYKLYISNTTEPTLTDWVSNTTVEQFDNIIGTPDLSTIYLNNVNNNIYVYKGILITPPEPVICFREGSRILIFNPATGREEYIAVENVRPGTLVKTRMSGYVPVCMVGTSTVTIPAGRDRTADRLYICSKDQFPELTEDLYITGHHSILVNDLTAGEREECIQDMGRVYATEGKYRLPAHIHRRTRVYEAPGAVERIWHFALEHNDEEMNYGVYANGLLVESCSIWRLRTMVGYELMVGNVYTVSNTVSAPPARLPIVC